MLFSALLTSVGINLALCFVFFVFYSVLRKQPSNEDVYAPRLLADGESQGRARFELDRLLPSAGWVARAWRLTESELLSVSGLDAVVFMRIFIFSFKVFAFATAVGILVLLPFNYMGNQLSLDFTDLPNRSLESFTISNVDDGSNRLWIHFSAVYVFTVYVCYLLYARSVHAILDAIFTMGHPKTVSLYFSTGEYDHIASKRLAFFNSSKPKPHEFTVLVRSIPPSPGKSYTEVVESFFMEYHPDTYLSHSVVRRTSKLKGLIDEADKLYRKLARLKTLDHSQERFGRAGFMGIFGPRVDLLGHYEMKLEDIEYKVRVERSSKEVQAAFVSFKTRFGAAVALNIRQSSNPTEWVTEPSPDPEDVYWPFFSASFFKRWFCNVAVYTACVVLTVLFLIPVLIVQGLTHLEQLEIWFPFLTGVLRMKFVSEVITGYLPSLILQMFLSLVPPAMMIFSSIQGYIALSQIERSACFKVLWFTIWNIFFANALSGSVLYRVEVFLELKNIPSMLAVAVPGQATFFIAYVVTSGWTKTASELLRLKPFVSSFFKRRLCNTSSEQFEVPSIPYHSEIPRILLFGVLGVTYFFLAPLMLPFIVIFYCLGYVVYRHQLLYVYAPKFETGGQFWPIVHDSTIFSLILMHVIAIGIFGLKKLSLASSLTIPLPILTLIFNNYCRRRFLPIFMAYSAESLISKDRSDRNDPTISAFYEKLETAYQDPTLMPVSSFRSNDHQTAPLLHTT